MPRASSESHAAPARKLIAPDLPANPPDGYVVLPFVNDTHTTSYEWMRVGLPAILAERLEGHPGLRPLYGELIMPDGAPVEPTAENIVAAARASGAKLVFTGSYSRPEWKLAFTLRAYTVEGDVATLAAEKTEHGDFKDVFELLDDATLDVLARTGHGVTSPVAEHLKRVPARDFYSFMLYGRGLAEIHGMGGGSDLVKAEKDLTKSVFIDPKFAEAHRLLALVYQKKGETGKARGQLNYALDLRPDYYGPIVLLVKSGYAAKERDEAIELAVRALTIRPWDLEVRFMLGDMLWEEGDAAGALHELKQITDFNPDDVQARRVLVLVHAAQGNMEQLADELQALIRLDPDDLASQIDLGAAYHALGRDEDAKAAYEAVVAKNPHDLQALKLLGDLARQHGDLNAAIGYYERALEANRTDPRPYFVLGAAYASAGDEEKAVKIYLAAEKFPRYLPEAYSNLGAIYLKRGQNTEALAVLRQAAAKRPANPRIHYNYGLALARAHVRDKALDEFQLASELDPKDADLQYALGVALLRVGKLGEAEKAFEEAVKIDPGHEDAKHNLLLIEELRRRSTEGEIRPE